MDRLSVGMHVEITRSDGRVHGALVTQLKHDTKAVSVEWFEKGETKGKEVDLYTIMRTNPMLFQQSVIPPPIVLNNNFNNVRSVRNARIKDDIALSQLKENQNFQKVSNRRSVIQSNLVPQSQPVTTVVSDNTANIQLGEPIVNKRRTTNVSRIPPSRLSRIGVTNEGRVPDIKEINQEETVIVTCQKTQSVAKIEEIEKNRDQRRQQQNEIKKLKEVQKNIDPGNPNWQFLSMIRDYQSQVDYKPLKISDNVVDNRICVCVRKRPINKKELNKKEIEIITIPNKDHIIVHQPQVKVDLTKYLENQIFRFDYTFDENTSNEMVYKFTAQPLVRTIFQGGFATCFAYGQTGSGKTHTMGGIFDGKIQNCANGIYALTAIDVFKILASNEFKNQKLSISCSFFEIYGAKVFDLLGKKAKLRVLEDGKKLVQVVGLKEFRVQNADDVLQLIKQGSEQRTAGQTSANSNSSRSHAVFQIILRKKEGVQENLYGKFSLIDLAGNERGADTISSDRQTRLEGAEINKSLLALKECIRAMGKDVTHVPFRGSKLTLILRDSFVGKNAKTCMIAMISPGMSCVENTLNTLRYADRVKELGNENGAATLSDGDFLVNVNGDVDLQKKNNNCFENKDNQQDLEMLHRRNNDLMNEEAYKYQLAIENMNKAEEEAIDEQQILWEKLQNSIKTIAKRLEETNLVDYDMENYARSSLKDICEIINSAKKCKTSFENLINRIVEEQEFLSKK